MTFDRLLTQFWKMFAYVLLVHGHFGRHLLSLGNLPLKLSLLNMISSEKLCFEYIPNPRADKYRLKCCFSVRVFRPCLTKVLFQEMSVQICTTHFELIKPIQ